jgi:hypothetical protein
MMQIENNGKPGWIANIVADDVIAWWDASFDASGHK